MQVLLLSNANKMRSDCKALYEVTVAVSSLYLVGTLVTKPHSECFIIKCFQLIRFCFQYNYVNMVIYHISPVVKAFLSLSPLLQNTARSLL